MDMQQTLKGKSIKRNAIPKEKPPESEETERLKQATNLRTTALRKLKIQLDKANVDCSTADDDLRKLTNKGYPDAMTESLMTEIKDFRQCHQRHQKYDVDEMTKMQANMTEEQMSADTHIIDEDTKSLTTEMQACQRAF